MKNPIIPEKELNKLKEVLEGIHELYEIHKGLEPDFTVETTDIQKVHILIYLDTLDDFLKSAKILMELLEISEEEFVKTATEDGKYTVEEMLSKIMQKIMLDMLSD